MSDISSIKTNIVTVPIESQGKWWSLNAQISNDFIDTMLFPCVGERFISANYTDMGFGLVLDGTWLKQSGLDI